MKFLDQYIDNIYQSIGTEFLIKFVIVYFFIIWISLIVWVLKDIINRSTNPIFQFIALFLAIIPFFGIFLYLLIRPSKTLYEKYYEEIEDNLDIINEIIEERKKQFEKKVNNSIEGEKRQILKKDFSEKKSLNLDKKINFIYHVEFLSDNNDDYKVGKKEIRITQIKKRNF